MGQGNGDSSVNGFVRRVMPFVVAVLLPVCGWVAGQTVDHGKTLSGLASEQNGIAREVTILRGEMKDRFREIREDIKGLADRMERLVGLSVLIHIGDAEHNAWRDGDVLAARTERDALAVHAQHIVKNQVPPHGLGSREFADSAHAELRVLWKDMTKSAASPIPSGPNLDAWWERARELGLSPEVHRHWPFTNPERARHLAVELSIDLDAVTAARWAEHPATVNRKRKIDWRKHVLPHASIDRRFTPGGTVGEAPRPIRFALDLDVVDHRQIVTVAKRIDVGLFIERVDGRPVRPSGQGGPT